MIEESRNKLIRAEELIREVAEVSEVTSTLFRHLQDIRLKLNGVMRMMFGVK